MWRTVYNLDFSLQYNYYAYGVQQPAEDIDEKFAEFVNHVLLHLDARVLNKFRLVWTPECIESHVISWIKFAVARNVHHVSLTLDDCNHPFEMMLPISDFSCDSLRSLKLGDIVCISAKTVFCLPRLESLDLYGVFRSQEALEKIIRGCPVLNTLKIVIDDDDRDNEFPFVISSTSLRRLELDLGCGSRHLKVEACSLVYLKIHNFGYVYMNFVQNNLTSLVEADLSFDMERGDKYHHEADVCYPIGALDCVQILTLSQVVMEGLSVATKSSSTCFKRLVKLEATFTSHFWSPLQELIQRSNSLEALTIHKIPMWSGRGGPQNYLFNFWTTPVEVPKCLSTSLKEVVFDDYNGYPDEREMICYMLKHGNVLEDMHIRISCDRESDGEKLKLVQEICEFPRKSPVCKVKFSDAAFKVRI